MSATPLFPVIYSVSELIPEGLGITTITLPVTNAANRLDPRPLPQDPNTTQIFTISSSAEPPSLYQPFVPATKVWAMH